MPTAPPKNQVVTVERKPDRLEDPTNFLADDFDDKAVKAAVDELAPMCDEHRRRSFDWYYEMGKVVRDHYEALQEKRQNMYGERFFNRLAQDLNRPGVSGPLLSDCFRLVKHYSEKEYRKLSQQAAITPTHLLTLAGIGDRKRRDKLIKKVVSENLTTKQLNEAMKEELGPRRKPGAGRPPKRPKKLTDAFVHLKTQVEKFVNLNNAVWFGTDYHIVKEIQKLPADKLTDKFRDQLVDAAEQCESLAATATSDAEALRAALAEVDDRRQTQAEGEAELKDALEAEDQVNEAVLAETQAKRKARRNGVQRGRIHELDESFMQSSWKLRACTIGCTEAADRCSFEMDHLPPLGDP